MISLTSIGGAMIESSHTDARHKSTSFRLSYAASLFLFKGSEVLMRWFITSFSLFAMLIATSASAGTIPGRIVLGTDDAPADPFPRFFDTASGFIQGSTSFTNSVSFDDGVGKVDYTITIEAFNAAGAPAGLNVGVGAAGVELGVDNSRIDTGESIKVTYDSISHSQIGGPTTIASYITTLNAVHFISFGAGDTFTYSGVGAGGITGDDTFEVLVGASIATGDTLTVTGDSGAFKMQWLSHVTEYELVPEPSTMIFAAFGLVATVLRRRNG